MPFAVQRKLTQLQEEFLNENKINPAFIAFYLGKLCNHFLPQFPIYKMG